MDEAHKELVKRLRTHKQPNATYYVDVDCTEAALALETLAGEVEFVKGQLAGTNRNIAGWLQSRDDNLKRAEAAEAERDRLKAVLKPRLNAKAIEGLQEILEAMEALDEREAPFLKTLLDWHEATRKALGDAS